MTQILLKNDVEKSKIDALLSYLKTLNIDAEIDSKIAKLNKEKQKFTLATGIWEDSQIDSKTLRQQAWSR